MGDVKQTKDVVASDRKTSQSIPVPRARKVSRGCEDSGISSLDTGFSRPIATPRSYGNDSTTGVFLTSTPPSSFSDAYHERYKRIPEESIKFDADYMSAVVSQLTYLLSLSSEEESLIVKVLLWLKLFMTDDTPTLKLLQREMESFSAESLQESECDTSASEGEGGNDDCREPLEELDKFPASANPEIVQCVSSEFARILSTSTLHGLFRRSLGFQRDALAALRLVEDVIQKEALCGLRFLLDAFLALAWKGAYVGPGMFYLTPLSVVFQEDEKTGCTARLQHLITLGADPKEKNCVGEDSLARLINLDDPHWVVFLLRAGGAYPLLKRCCFDEEPSPKTRWEIITVALAKVPECASEVERFLFRKLKRLLEALTRSHCFVLSFFNHLKQTGRQYPNCFFDISPPGGRRCSRLLHPVDYCLQLPNYDDEPFLSDRSRQLLTMLRSVFPYSVSPGLAMLTFFKKPAPKSCPPLGNEDDALALADDEDEGEEPDPTPHPYALVFRVGLDGKCYTPNSPKTDGCLVL